MEFQRKKLRCSEIDYSLPGKYFLTICTFERQKLFGAEPFSVNNWFKETGKYQYGDGINLLCNRPEQMIEKWIHQIPNKFVSVKIDYYVIMPDHIHMILAISGKEKDSTDFCSCVSIDKIIDWFKTMTTCEYIRYVKKNEYPPFKKHIWQRGYYDHAIRNDDDLYECRRYIKMNPIKIEKKEDI